MINHEKKRFIKHYAKFLLFAICTLFLLTGYTFPQKGSPYYIKGSGSLGQDVTVYIPFNANYRFSVDMDSSEVINIGSVSATGYLSGDRTMTFPTFDSPYIRNGTSYTIVTWSEIESYNLPLLDSPDSHLGTAVVCVGLLIFMILCLKR